MPASFETVWGVRDRPTKGPRPGLSLDQIINAGIEVANADGIAGVSMNRVATQLGTSAMSLYRYVASKDELFALMIDGAFGRVEWAPIEGTWRERLTHWSTAEVTAYERFPWVLRVPVTGAPVTPHQMWFMEHGLRALAETSLAEHEKLSAILLITSVTRSFALYASELNAAVAAGNSAAALMADYGGLVRRLTTQEDFPALHAVVASGAFEDDEIEGFEGLELDYRFGLERVLDGIEALIRVRG